MTMPERVRQDLIFGPETCRDERETCERKTTDQERPECDRHLPTQATHIEHILGIDFVIAGMQNTMLHAMNNRAGTQEEQGLEEGVRNEMEDRRHVCADPQRGDHEAKLRD